MRKTHCLSLPPRGSSGMTLVETLLALSIAVVLMALVYSIFNTVGRVMRGQGTRDRKLQALQVLDRISNELTFACPTTSTNSPAFKLWTANEGDLGERRVVEFSTLSNSQDGILWSSVIRKTYSLNADRELMCETMPLRGPGSLTTGEVVRVLGNVDSFNVKVYAEGDWKKEWESQAELPFPQIVRVGIVLRNRPTSETNSVRVLIPAGNPVASTIERSSKE